MPALNIPLTAAQELNRVQRNKNTTAVIGFIFFIWMFNKNLFLFKDIPESISLVRCKIPKTRKH